MENNNGWIKIHRKILDNPIIMKDSDHLAVWMYLLLNATHSEYPALFKGQKIMLKPGQLITGRKSIAATLNITESKIRRVLDDFESDQQISRQRSNKNTLISLDNWDKYQCFDQQSDQQATNKKSRKRTLPRESEGKIDQQSDQQKKSENTEKSMGCDTCNKESDQQSDQQATNNRPTTDQQPTTNKNVKNVKKEKNERKTYSDNPLLNDSIIEFVEYRKSIKKPMTDYAVKLLIGKLDNMTSDVNEQIEILNQSIVNGWTGVFPLKQEQAKQTARPNAFHNFHQRQYDYEKLEGVLLNSQPDNRECDDP